MEYYQDEFVTEYSKSNFTQAAFFTKKRPTTSLDYMKLNSEEHLKYKFEEKVRVQIKELNLDQRHLKEICELSYYYSKLLKQSKDVSLKKSDVISIVTFKIIKKHSMPFTHNEIYAKINLDKGKYLKYSNLFHIDDSQESNFKIENEPKNPHLFLNNFITSCNNNIEEAHVEKNKFIKEVLHYLNFLIARLSNIYLLNPNIFKLETSKINVDKYLNKLSSLLEVKSDNSNKINIQASIAFNDNVKLLEEIKAEAKSLIYNSNAYGDGVNNFDFYSFFHNKILVDALSAGVIKFLMERKGVRINMQVFKENFRISSSSISRAIKSIEEFVKLNNL